MQPNNFELNFDMEIERIENYMRETDEFLKTGQIEKKVVKIDLENISSGDGSDFSGDSSSPSPNYKSSLRDDALEMEFTSKTSAVPSESPSPTKKARKSRKDRMGKAQESVTYSQNDSEIDKIRIGQSIHNSYNKQKKAVNAIPSTIRAIDLKIQVNQLNLKDLQNGIKSPLSIAASS